MSFFLMVILAAGVVRTFDLAFSKAIQEKKKY